MATHLTLNILTSQGCYTDIGLVVATCVVQQLCHSQSTYACEHLSQKSSMWVVQYREKFCVCVCVCVMGTNPSSILPPLLSLSSYPAYHCPKAFLHPALPPSPSLPRITLSSSSSSQPSLLCSCSLSHGDPASLDPTRYLKRAARKTINVVLQVENAGTEAQTRELIRKNTRLLPRTLLEALEDRIKSRKWQKALKIFELLRDQLWYEPNVATYIKLLDMLGKCKQPEAASSLFQTMQGEKCAPTVEAYTALLSVYTRNQLLDRAFAVFEDMKMVHDCHPDIFTYSLMIKAYSEAYLFERVERLFSELRSNGIKPTTVTFNTLIDAYGRAGMFREMEIVFSSMIEGGDCEPDSWTQNAIIRSFAMRECIEKMEWWYVKLQSMGVQPDVITFNILLNAYGKVGLTEKMTNVTKFMDKYHFSKDIVTYNILIDAYGKAGMIELMGVTYNKMKVEGVKPNSHTFCSLLDAYGKKGIRKKIEKIMHQVRNCGVELDTAVFNAAIDAYRRTENFAAIDTVLVEMKERGCQPDSYTRTILSMAEKHKGTQESLSGC